jgi:hypothetical protein
MYNSVVLLPFHNHYHGFSQNYHNMNYGAGEYNNFSAAVVRAQPIEGPLSL